MHDFLERNRSLAERTAVWLAARRLTRITKLHERQPRQQARQPLQKQRLMAPVIRIERDPQRRRAVAVDELQRFIKAIEKRELAAAVTPHRLDGQHDSALFGQRQQLVEGLPKQAASVVMRMHSPSAAVQDQATRRESR